MTLGFTEYVNIGISILFAVLSVLMFLRWKKWHKKVIIQDQQWSLMRMCFLVIGIFALISIVYQGTTNTIFDYVRLAFTVIAVSAYMLIRDGVGEEGLLSGGKFYPWNIVRAYDYEERNKVIAVYFTIESQDEKKPDAYRTKELDFALTDKEYLMKFLQMNIKRKYTRMKKKSK